MEKQIFNAEWRYPANAESRDKDIFYDADFLADIRC